MPIAETAFQDSPHQGVYSPYFEYSQSDQHSAQFIKDLDEMFLGSEFLRSFEQDLLARNQLQELQQLDGGWDSYGAPPPNGTAFDLAGKVLAAARKQRVEFNKIVPSVEGGIGVCFVRDDRYAHIEASNEGELMLVMFSGQAPAEIIEIDGEDALPEALNRIRGHLDT